MAGLKLQAVSKSWDGKTHVIPPLTLDAADGEFIVIGRPSGCGKTNLMRMVAGLGRVGSGDILLGRTRGTEEEAEDRGIAVVVHKYDPYTRESVEENLAAGLQLRG
ncbi:ATP-binding cassette domain-containing protein, partial [Klebsiella pneumoniae]|uniref:ATP-binding cassette domain-containing protein n=1 Tax=Klebsiella pneumoniae TaxID=573 RepID=UPI0027673A87|nr:ABC transporter ATP-binding protein [Klebsiella pneumoniae]